MLWFCDIGCQIKYLGAYFEWLLWAELFLMNSRCGLWLLQPMLWIEHWALTWDINFLTLSCFEGNAVDICGKAMWLKSSNCPGWPRNIASSSVGGMQDGGSRWQELENAGRDKADGARQLRAMLASQSLTGAAFPSSCSSIYLMVKC